MPTFRVRGQTQTCAAFFERAIEFYKGHGITIERVITDNHWSY
jgi:hypothetical protein